MKHSLPKSYQIDRYFTGDLSAQESKELESHFEECQVCFNYLQTLRREKNEFLAAHPFSSVFRVRGSERVPWYQFAIKIWSKPVLVPVFAVLVAVAIGLPLLQGTGKVREDVLFKGQSSLSFIYKRDGVVRDGELSELFYANDQIQIRYSSSKEQYIALISIDSRGTVSFYHPDEQSRFCSIQTGTGSNLSFPGSIILDDAEGAELIIAVFSSAPLKTSAVNAWAENAFREHPELSKLARHLSENIPFKGGQVASLLLRKG